SVLVGPSGGLQQAVEAAAGYYSQMFSNNEVINIDISWGEVIGMPISPGDLADGVRPGIYRTYAQVLNGLKADAGHSSVQRRRTRGYPLPIRCTRISIMCLTLKPRRVSKFPRRERKSTAILACRKPIDLTT